MSACLCLVMEQVRRTQRMTSTLTPNTRLDRMETSRTNISCLCAVSGLGLTSSLNRYVRVKWILK